MVIEAGWHESVSEAPPSTRRQAVLRASGFSATLALAVLLSGCGGGTADVKAGGTIYAAQCARCHGDNGEGGAGPSLIGIARVFETAEGQERFVKNGGTGMPMFGQILSDDEIRNAVAYTRETFR
jgi:mono/diheme cytochrome c family protein